ncbi:MAG: FtsW/RodA/SpoVE family cell cycle protein [Ignavibacteriales bacterium]|nr:FtsW/RodA/SpoVE family cell cycle protein [Ignavibacteriales bacterium]
MAAVEYLELELATAGKAICFLPEAYGDFIFAILGEETWISLVPLLVLLVYIVLFVAGILIAKKAKDKFGQMLAFGISFSIVILCICKCCSYNRIISNNRTCRCHLLVMAELQ